MFNNRYDGIVGFFSIVRSLEGRKKLQKAIYLAKEHGFPGLQERFDFHWYGPYSEMLANKIQELVQLGVLNEKEVSHNYRTYAYEITESAVEYFHKQIEHAQKYQSLITHIVKEDARLLELTSSLHYFIANGYDREKAEREVKRVKPEKNYSSDEIQQAWSFLDELKNIEIRVLDTQ